MLLSPTQSLPKQTPVYLDTTTWKGKPLRPQSNLHCPNFTLLLIVLRANTEANTDSNTDANTGAYNCFVCPPR